MSDIVDDIDRLVDEQLAGGEPSPADQRYPKCGHCGRDFHHLVVTERIAAMYVRGVYEEDYRVGGDDSHVLCRGSEFIGPMPPETQAGPWEWARDTGWTMAPVQRDALTDDGQVVIDHAVDTITGLIASVCGLGDSLRGFGLRAFESAARIGDLAMFITGEELE